MKFGKKRAAAGLLALCMVLGLLAGCGKKGDTQQLSATVYVPKFLDLGVELDEVVNSCTDGTNLYLVGQKENREEIKDPENGETYYNYSWIPDLYRVSLEDGKGERLPNYEAPTVPEGYEGSANIEAISAAGDGTLWVTESVYIWGRSDEKYPDTDMPVAEPRAAIAEAVIAVDDVAVDVEEPADVPADYFEPQDTTVRRHLSADGAELERLDLEGLEEKLEVDYVNSTSFGTDGNVYIMANGKFFVLDSQLNVLFTMEVSEDMWPDVTSLGDGSAAVRSWFYDEEKESGGYKLTTIDMEAQDWGEEYLLPSSAYTVYTGGGDYLFYYQTGDSIYGWRADAPEGTETGERLFSWIEADINSDDIQNFFFLPDGRVAAVTREWKEEGGVDFGLVLMTATPRSELPEKTTLVYATMYLDYQDRRSIIDFNKTSEKYRIEVKDYSEYNTATDASAGLQKLNTEIVAGVVPDILYTSNLPLRQYAAKGVLEDLWPMIDSDPELGRDALMVQPLKADEQDGKLYEVVSNFSIQTVIGAKKIVGDRMSWTLADLQAALAQMPEGCAIFGEDDTKMGMLNSVLNMNMNSFVDWESGKCYFDGATFKSLLAFCNSFVDEYDYDNVDWSEWEDSDSRIYSGKQMLMPAYVSNFEWGLRRYCALFPDGLSYVGYPMEDGSVGSSFSLTSGLAISSTCKDKEGAWSFVRQRLLSRDSESYYYGNFPINKADFERMMEESMTPQYVTDENGDPLLDENNEPIMEGLGSLWFQDGTELPYHLTTQEEVDQLMALYNSITTVARYDENIYEIVSEVAGSYFAGDRNLDDTANLIQSRVNIYVNESK